MARSFLFLQGICSPFFSRLGAKLRARGHKVTKINFIVGDSIYWDGPVALAYRGDMGSLPAYYREIYNDNQVTDIVLFGDCRPVHRPAIEIARGQGIRIHVFEEGYFRPYWVTLERDGVNGYSHLPRDPAWYMDTAKKVPQYDNGYAFKSSFLTRAVYDVGYHFLDGLNPFLFPGYKSHVPFNSATEYFSYLKRAIRIKKRENHDRKSTKCLIEQVATRPFFLVPIQLASDAQIRYHSSFSDTCEFLGLVFRSFAQNAHGDSRLVVKNHPLDPGFIDYYDVCLKLAKEFGVEGRVVYLETGHLPTLLGHTSGVITINSTVGGSALIHRRPTIALGRAIYDMAGLTFQGGLANFWRARAEPDMRLFRKFRNVVIHTTQINGGFYCRKGNEMAIGNAIESLESEYSRLEKLNG